MPPAATGCGSAGGGSSCRRCGAGRGGSGGLLGPQGGSLPFGGGAGGGRSGGLTGRLGLGDRLAERGIGLRLQRREILRRLQRQRVVGVEGLEELVLLGLLGGELRPQAVGVLAGSLQRVGHVLVRTEHERRVAAALGHADREVVVGQKCGQTVGLVADLVGLEGEVDERRGELGDLPILLGELGLGRGDIGRCLIEVDLRLVVLLGELRRPLALLVDLLGNALGLRLEVGHLVGVSRYGKAEKGDDHEAEHDRSSASGHGRGP